MLMVFIMNVTYEQFDNYFETKIGDSAGLVECCQALRYQVYCEEKHYLNSSDYLLEKENDEFDRRSIHALLVHKKTGISVATVRLIVNEAKCASAVLPTERYNILRRKGRDSIWQVSPLVKGEISRLAVSKNFRRRIEEQNNIHGISSSLSFAEKQKEKRHTSQITLGLFRALMNMATESGVTHVYALMEPQLINLLSRSGIKFTPVGAMVDCYGLRQPCMATVEELLNGIKKHDERIWTFITHNGQKVIKTEGAQFAG